MGFTESNWPWNIHECLKKKKNLEKRIHDGGKIRTDLHAMAMKFGGPHEPFEPIRIIRCDRYYEETWRERKQRAKEGGNWFEINWVFQKYIWMTPHNIQSNQEGVIESDR